MSSTGPARLLAIDTSTESMCVALHSEAGLSTWAGAGGAASSSLLLPKVRELLRSQGLAYSDLQAVAFGSGPGAFTGLRTACAVAQGLAFALGVPVLPLDSLLIVAEDAHAAAHGDAVVHVAMDARMGEAYAGVYRCADGRWQVLSAPALFTLAALNAAWRASPPELVAGSARRAFGDGLDTAGARCVDSEADRAGALMALAQRAWLAGHHVAAEAAVPLYVRDKVASTLAERAAAAGS